MKNYLIIYLDNNYENQIWQTGAESSLDALLLFYAYCGGNPFFSPEQLKQIGETMGEDKIIKMFQRDYNTIVSYGVYLPEWEMEE